MGIIQNRKYTCALPLQYEMGRGRESAYLAGHHSYIWLLKNAISTCFWLFLLTFEIWVYSNRAHFWNMWKSVTQIPSAQKVLKSLTGEYSKLQPHHNISLSQNKLSGAVEIFMAVFFEKFIGKFFYEDCHKNLNSPKDHVSAKRNFLVRL